MEPSRLARHLAVAVALAASTAAAASAAGKQWSVVELTADSAWGGTARAVNNKGDVVGQTYTRENGVFVSHAYLWQNGARIDIGARAGHDTTPWAIDDRGTIVGFADGFATVWRDGTPTSLQFAGEASGINRSETLIGRYWTGGRYGYGQDRAIVYRDGVLTELGTLGGVYSGAGGIDDKGVIVGSSYLPRSSTFRAFVWQDGTMRELPGLGGSESLAGRINNHGVIIGTAFDAAGKQWMVRWTDTSLPPEKLMERGGASAINDHGDIVGNNLNTGKPFLMERDGTLTWLLDLPAMRSAGYTSFAPMGINDHGWIVGIAFRPGGSSLGTALLLTPK